MKRFLLILVLFVTAYSLNAQDQIKIPMKISSDDGELYELLLFGVDRSASDSIDWDLGERALPPFPPPGGTMYSVMVFDNLIEDDPDTEVWSYKDFRNLPADTDRFYHEYKVFFWRGSGQTLTFNWGDDFQKYVDSAYFQYFVGDIEIFKADMKNSNSFTVENSEIRKANIKIWYNLDAGNVEYVNDSKKFSIYPNPAQEHINFNHDFDMKSIRIMDMLGNDVIDNNSYSNSIYIGNLSAGQYILIARSINNTYYYQKFIKL